MFPKPTKKSTYALQNKYAITNSFSEKRFRVFLATSSTSMLISLAASLWTVFLSTTMLAPIALLTATANKIRTQNSWKKDEARNVLNSLRDKVETVSSPTDSLTAKNATSSTRCSPPRRGGHVQLLDRVCAPTGALLAGAAGWVYGLTGAARD